MIIKIEKQQYIEALILIDQYHMQEDRKVKFTPIKEWINSRKTTVSTRLIRILTENPDCINGTPYPYLEQITETELRKFRNIGKQTVEEFRNLKNS